MAKKKKAKNPVKISFRRSLTFSFDCGDMGEVTETTPGSSVFEFTFPSETGTLTKREVLALGEGLVALATTEK